MAAWVVAAVAAGHGLFFWLVENKQFMPDVGGYSPPPSPPNFGSRKTTTVDPRTGEATTETLFVVSTQLVTPTPGEAK